MLLTGVAGGCGRRGEGDGLDGLEGFVKIVRSRGERTSRLERIAASGWSVLLQRVGRRGAFPAGIGARDLDASLTALEIAVMDQPREIGA